MQWISLPNRLQLKGRTRKRVSYFGHFVQVHILGKDSRTPSVPFTQVIDLFHNGGQIKYSFVSILISLSNLAAMSKIQKNFCAEMRPVS